MDWTHILILGGFLTHGATTGSPFYSQLTKQSCLFRCYRFFIFHLWYFLMVLECVIVGNLKLDTNNKGNILFSYNLEKSRAAEAPSRGPIVKPTCFFPPLGFTFSQHGFIIMVPHLWPGGKNVVGFTLIGLVWVHAHFCQLLSPWDWSMDIELTLIMCFLESGMESAPIEPHGLQVKDLAFFCSSSGHGYDSGLDLWPRNLHRLSVWPKEEKKQSWMVVARGWEEGEMLVKRYTPPIIRWMSSGDT